MSETNEPTLEAAIGRRLKELRESRGLRQDQMAERLRAVGLPWSRSQEAKVERAERSVTLGEAVLLAFALYVPFAELVPEDGWVTLGAATRPTRLPAADLRSLFSGTHPAEALPPALEEGWSKRDSKQLHEDLERYRELWPKARVGQLVEAETAAQGEAEMKAAKRLGTDPVTVSIVAFRLWGRSLTTERDARAGDSEDVSPSSRQAHRGQVTRRLLTELAEVIKEAKL